MCMVYKSYDPVYTIYIYNTADVWDRRTGTSAVDEMTTTVQGSEEKRTVDF